MKGGQASSSDRAFDRINKEMSARNSKPLAEDPPG